MWVCGVCIIEGLALVAAGSIAATAALHALCALHMGFFAYFILCWYFKQFFFLISCFHTHRFTWTVKTGTLTCC